MSKVQTALSMKISRQGIYQALESPATRLQKAISYVLLIVILLAILALVVEERLPNVSEEFAGLLIALDYVILVIFGVEYITRLAVTPKPWRYAVSKEGVIDVLALLPSAVSLFVPALWNISWLRALRLFRFLRVLKLAEQVCAREPSGPASSHASGHILASPSPSKRWRSLSNAKHGGRRSAISRPC